MRTSTEATLPVIDDAPGRTYHVRVALVLLWSSLTVAVASLVLRWLFVV